jgi:polysaccharide pyruvyl transferase WcaK-like protein
MMNRATIKANLRFVGRALRRPANPLLYCAGWLGFGNLGDEALLAAARRLAPASRPMVNVSTRVAPPLVRLLPRPRTALLAGGTLINGSPAWLDLFSRCQELCDDALVFGSGVQNPGFGGVRADVPDIRHRWVPVLRRCRYVGVRGPASAALLADAGFPDAEVLGDPVLVFADEAARRPISMPTAGVLGLNLGQAGNLQLGDSDEVAREMAELARAATQRGWQVRWYVVWTGDRAITRAAAEASGTADDIREFFDDHHAFMADVAGCDVFAGVKLHAVVLASCVFVPSLMVEYRPKCRDFMMSIGREEATVRADRFAAGPALEMLDAWMQARDRESAAVAAGVLPVAERLRRRAREVFGSGEPRDQEA